jgi:hypothetical protein
VTTFECCGHTWELVVGLDEIRRVREEAGVALSALLYATRPEDPPGLNVLVEQNQDLFAATIWALVRPQAKERKITKGTFYEFFVELPPMEEAARALARAIPFFFRQPEKHRLTTALSEIAIGLLDLRKEQRAAGLAAIDAGPIANPRGSSPPANPAPPSDCAGDSAA